MLIDARERFKKRQGCVFDFAGYLDLPTENIRIKRFENNEELGTLVVYYQFKRANGRKWFNQRLVLCTPETESLKAKLNLDSPFEDAYKTAHKKYK